MKKLIILFTMIIIILSTFVSLIGIFNYQNMNYQSFTTARGEKIEILKEGIYKFNSKSFVIVGAPWDIVRIIFCIPLLIFSFVLFLKKSLKGTLLLIGVLANLFYQYLLWAMGWTLNPLFLAYIIIYSLCLITDPTPIFDHFQV